MQGIEDPDFEVFPTKKDGKFIVKLREKKLNVTPQEESVDVIESDTINKKDPPNDDGNDNESTVRSWPTTASVHSRPTSISVRSRPDSTINIEILEQLLNLDEEIRNDRISDFDSLLNNLVIYGEIKKQFP